MIIGGATAAPAKNRLNSQTCRRSGNSGAAAPATEPVSKVVTPWLSACHMPMPADSVAGTRAAPATHSSVRFRTRSSPTSSTEVIP
ncbi:hypothetical protein GCM10009605_50500 [Nocardiopsis composta]